MKAVLMSIQPKWCELIASGKKTTEVRKTRPKLETPFKCYIYCTKTGFLFGEKYGFKQWASMGKVMGEFVCDAIFDICIGLSDVNGFSGCPFPGTGLLDIEIMQYLGNGETGYGWHISDLQIYDRPKELNELYKPDYPTDFWPKDISIKRPPQSWCYVEELP